MPPVKIRCHKCGATFFRAQAILWSGILYCPTCHAKVRE